VESLLSVSQFRVAKKRENASNLRKALRKRLLRRLWTVQHVLFVNVMTVQRCTPLSYDHDQCYNLRQNYLRQIENTPVFSYCFLLNLLHYCISIYPPPSPLSMLFWRPQDLYRQAWCPKQHCTGVGRWAICTGLAMSNNGVDIGKQADLSQEFCPKL